MKYISIGQNELKNIGILDISKNPVSYIPSISLWSIYKLIAASVFFNLRIVNKSPAEMSTPIGALLELRLGDSCERGFFNLRGGWGHFFCYIFQKYTFISPKCLIIPCILVFFTIVQLLQKSLHTAQAWFHTGVHYWSICLAQTQHVSIILISNLNIVTENTFSLWFFFILQYNLYRHV